MGFGEHFAWTHPAEILAEHARLTGHRNDGSRDLDIGALGTVTRAEYDALAPFQWPRPAGAEPRTTRFFADGGYYTPDRRARFVPTPYRAPAVAISEQYPFVLNTGRIRDQWHTMTRTAKTPRLMNHIAEPFLEVHPDDANRLGLRQAGLATVSSPHGSAILRVLVTPQQRPGSVFAPMHWTGQFASRARIDALVGAITDPVSGQPELKAAPVRVAPFAAAWYGFAIARARPENILAEYWALAPATGGWRVELAGLERPADWETFARALLGFDSRDTHEVLAYHDAAGGRHRFAAFDGAQLIGAVFLAREPVVVSRSWASGKLAATFADGRERLALLAGRAGAAEPDKGAIVCACFEVGRNQIVASMKSGACRSVADIGAALKAGTNCGSCRAEIGRILRADRIPAAV